MDLILFLVGFKYFKIGFDVLDCRGLRKLLVGIIVGFLHRYKLVIVGVVRVLARVVP